MYSVSRSACGPNGDKYGPAIVQILQVHKKSILFTKNKFNLIQFTKISYKENLDTKRKNELLLSFFYRYSMYKKYRRYVSTSQFATDAFRWQILFVIRNFERCAHNCCIHLRLLSTPFMRMLPYQSPYDWPTSGAIGGIFPSF